MAPASGAWAGMEEPGGAATAQLLLAGSRGPNVAQPGELQGRRANSALLAFLCAPGTRTAEPWAQERSDPAASSQTPLPSIALPPASTQPGCRPARATGLVVTPQSPPAPPFARTGCSMAKAAPVPHLSYLGENAEEGEEEELLLQLEPHGALPSAASAHHPPGS